MEQKKTDTNAMIGFLLIGAILLWLIYDRQNSEKIPEKEKINLKKSIQKKKNPEKKIPKKDSIKNTEILKEEFITLENDVLKLTFTNKGGQIKKAALKKYKTYDKKTLFLIDDSSFLNLDLEGIAHTKNLFFTPEITQKKNMQMLSFTSKIKEKTIVFKYILKDDYLIDFQVYSDNLELDAANLDFHFKALSNEKSTHYENQNTALYYGLNDGSSDDLSVSGEDSETEKNINWVAFKQHFFSCILRKEQPFEQVKMRSETLFEEGKNTKYTKVFDLKAPLKLNGNILNFNLYLGPNQYKKLASYEKGFENIVELGWGIFGWINKNAFIPLFSFLGSLFSNYGLVIILMTIIVRIFMSPLVYKSYLSSAKMKVLRPEMEAINKKYPGKDNTMKRQQEIMTLQRKAGVNMLSGCIPALLQMPVFFALFRFFPSAIDLRGKSFLWAKDLSSYDSVLKLPFRIPFYGDHVSLFPILASLAIFFYMKMNQSQQMTMQQPSQEGIPDMQKIMKMMIYLSPIMMLIFFNSYGAGLSLYYFISNTLTLLIMFIIKNWIIDEDKIHAQIQENKKRPEKKKSKFRERFEEAMKEAQKRQEINKKRR